MRHGKRLWIEDDCTIYDPFHERLPAAYKRLFGVDLVDALIGSLVEDEGDGEMILTSHAVVWRSYPGNNAIYAKE